MSTAAYNGTITWIEMFIQHQLRLTSTTATYQATPQACQTADTTRNGWTTSMAERLLDALDTRYSYIEERLAARGG